MPYVKVTILFLKMKEKFTCTLILEIVDAQEQ
jgi:hypothetical protein|nr:MAG TPA: hypothetical protein [Bacteriophage sp.]DAZ66840.1 MAG TPA: hypothetical protein [Caudoviricetes sp.]